MTRNIFLSYGSGTFVSARDHLCASAEKVGFDLVFRCGPDDLDADFRSRNSSILSQARGAGYWSWKPQIILQVLQKLCEGDVLVYCDAGRYYYYDFEMLPRTLIEQTRAKGVLLNATIPHHGPLSKWTKRDCLILLDMDRPEILCKPQIQATWSMWTPTPAAFEFLERWVTACCDARVLTDQKNVMGLPNYPDFIDHRHDQSIFTLLIYKYGLPHLDYRAKGLDKILKLRVKSGLAQRFMARIDDAERMEQGHMIQALLLSFLKLKRIKRMNN